MKIVFLFLYSVLFCQVVLAGTETFSQRAEGSKLVVSSTVPLYTVYDNQYGTMLANAGWQSQFSNTGVKNFLRLGINPDVAQANLLNGSMTFTIKTWTWNVGGYFDVNTIPNVSLGLYYEHNNPTTILVNDVSTYDFSNAHRVEVYLTGITNTSGFDVNELYVQTEIQVERRWALDANVVTGAGLELVNNSNYIKFHWNPKSGAEFYELEWVHVPTTKLDGSTESNTALLKYNHYLNSTRIVVKANNYRIPAIFDPGYILFRVRPIGFTGTGLTVRKEGSWNVAAESGSVSTYPTASKLLLLNEYDQKMNWAHQVAYGDDGERFESVVFSDGLSRPRQSVTHNTATAQAVFSNVYYDELGRPVISDLPTPVDGEVLRHDDHFNLTDGTLADFQAAYFDVPGGDSCVVRGTGFSTTSGAGKYYSPSNTDQDAENKRIPNAEKFPYSRVVYESDFSGRVQKVSGYGKDLNTGSGKETFYHYPSANQSELDELFGAEVGRASHYSKMVTVDANGQVYVQYSDLAGRVIATYLAGQSPASLDAIEGNGGTNATVSLLPQNDQQVDLTVPSSTLTYTEYIYENASYSFSYGMTPEQFHNGCMPEDICLDCVYDLDFRITDQCGVVVYNHTETMPGADANRLCTTKEAEGFTTAPIYLQKGAYVFVKTLRINQDELHNNWCYYLNENACVEPVSDLFNTLYVQEEFDECEPLTDAPETGTGCNFYKELMLQDLTPGGQYAGFTNTGGVFTALPDIASVHSVLTEDNLEVGPDVTDNDWRHPVGHYQNADGSTSYITAYLVSGSYVPAMTGAPVAGPLADGSYTFYPEQLASLQDFISRFQPEWARSLLAYHPEYCFLNECELNDAYDYDALMMAASTYGEACSAGFFKPLAASAGYADCPTSFPDPFFATGSGSALSTAMNNAMNNYHASGYSIWQLAISISFCNTTVDIDNCLERFGSIITEHCYDDLIWINYRRMYLDLKQELFYQTLHSACSNAQIGVDVNWLNNVSRWGNVATFTDLDTDGSGPDTGTTLDQSYLDGLMQDGCQTACEAFADDWISQLSGCDFTGVNMTALRNDLVSLCMSGCDSEHPMGASTSPGGTTIDDVLLTHLGAGYETNLCSGLLISQPDVYQTNQELQEAITSPLDTCACTEILQAQWEFDNANPDELTLEQLLSLNTGVLLEEIDHLICLCQKPYGGAFDPLTVSWPQDANEQLEVYLQRIPATLSCSSGSCADCGKVNKILSDLSNRFSGVPDFENAENYQTIVTNYLNNELLFHLGFEDYLTFAGQCAATTETPYCTINPLAREWAEVMKLLTFRGDLLTGESSAFDLLPLNIVYAQGELQHALPGNSYWSDQSGNVLTTHFGSTTGTDCTFTLTLPEEADFDFGDIVSFGVIVPLTGSCTGNSTFGITVTYRSCGQLATAQLTGTSDCFEVNSCVCSGDGLTLCDELPGIQTTCYQPRLDELYQMAQNTWLENVQELYQPFVRDFNTACAEAFSTETLSYSGPRNVYQYTLFYYDQAGNLVKTIAPKGFEDAFTPVNSEAARASVQSSTVYNTVASYGVSPLPAHTFQTTYAYNSYDQPVNTMNPDYIASTNFWYDRYGRVAASQNAEQVIDKKYSYTLYDPQGRPVESGQADLDYTSSAQRPVISETDLKRDDLGVSFKNWVYSCKRSEITYTVYDAPMSPAVSSKFFGGTPQNLRLRVASVVYFDSLYTTLPMPLTGYASASHYSYDPHGNVKEFIQDIPVLAPAGQDVKSTQYEFELISGNVKKVSYQQGRPDATAHRYFYDQLNRLTEVYLTTDKGVHESREAQYRYFDYGPLSRVETGQHKVQANDYSYTINGWLKGMNSNTLRTNRDGGRDGDVNYYANLKYAHQLIAADVNGYTLGYFKQDYKSIGTTSFEASITTGLLYGALKDLYNGNISHSVTAITGYDVQAGVYTYDQLQRIKAMRVFRSTGVVSGNTWSAAAEPAGLDYSSTYTYDRNGNLQTLMRKGTSTVSLALDDLTYIYHSSNKLQQVLDPVPSGNYGDDIDDQTSVNNYTYSRIGQLTSDASEGLFFRWRRGDKKLAYQRSASVQIDYIYNPFGQRVARIKKACSGSAVVPNATTPWEYTVYGTDANGQVLAVYDVDLPASGFATAYLEEQLIYGAERLGMVKDRRIVYSAAMGEPITPIVKKNELGRKHYELTNHLGNVNVVISDRKQVAQNDHINELSDFESSLNGWSVQSPATVVLTAGAAQVTTSTTRNFITKNFTTVIGEEYTVAVNATFTTAPALELSVPGAVVNITSGVTAYATFTATTTSSQVRVRLTTLVSHVFNVQDIFVQTHARYTATTLMKADYYPFGMVMPGRSTNSGDYRYGYNGMEKDAELKGDGNSYTTEFRQYDPRLGRWMSLDPLMASFPGQSPYCAFDNNPILYTDPYGLASEGGPDDPPVGEVCQDENNNVRVYMGDDEWGDPDEFVSMMNLKMEINNAKIATIQNNDQAKVNKANIEIRIGAQMAAENEKTKAERSSMEDAMLYGWQRMNMSPMEREAERLASARHVYSMDRTAGLATGSCYPVSIADPLIAEGQEQLSNGLQSAGMEETAANYTSATVFFLGSVVITRKAGPGSLWSGTQKLNPVQNAYGHWVKHGAEFPEFQNSLQYVQGTRTFLHSSPTGTLVKVRTNGEVLKYHSASNTFGVMNASGIPKTMFRPTNGIIYWNSVK